MLWGSNMAKIHPVLWSQVTDPPAERAPHVHVAVSPATLRASPRCSTSPDIEMVFKPADRSRDLNAIANHIIQTKRVNREFVDKHTVFRHD